MAAGAYRFINPIDALGGIGPYDTFYPKDEAQEKEVEEMYEFPGYSQMMREKFNVEPWQTPSSFLDADESLYKDTLVDDNMKADYLQQKGLYDVLQLYNDDELRAELEEEGTSEEEIQEYFDLKNYTAKDFELLKYLSDRSALSHDIPGAVASIAGTFPVALGPLGAVGQGANLLKKGNKLSKMIKKAKEPLWAKSLDAGIGFGVPQGTGEYAVRKFQETEDEDSIYPVEY